MNLRKVVLFSAISCTALFGSVALTSCSEDSCEFLTCENGGSCADGFCTCQTGYEGPECKTKIADKFVGRYVGFAEVDMFGSLRDTVDVTYYAQPDSVSLYRRSNNELIVAKAVGAGKLQVDPKSEGNTLRTIDISLDGDRLFIYEEYDEDVNVADNSKFTRLKLVRHF